MESTARNLAAALALAVLAACGGATGSVEQQHDAASQPADGGGSVAADASGMAPDASGLAPDAGTMSISVSVSPAAIVLRPGASRDFTATVTGTANLSVTWAASSGTVAGSGATVTYTAPATTGSATLTATSVADPSRSARATIEVRDGAVHGMTIPADHPRLWWTPQRLDAARAWFTAHPFTPAANDYLGLALHSLMTGSAASCRAAIDYALGETITTDGVSSDGARWYGEDVLVTYDWCHGHFTQAERDALIARWNGYLEILMQKPWGGPDMPQNNYYWGYLRNQLEWGIATYFENPMADQFLADALTARWEQSFLPHAASAGRGGVAQEGSQYGAYMIGYPVVPFVTAGELGRDLYGETDFFKEAVFALLYGTLPAPTHADASTTRFHLFPSNDDEQFARFGSAEKTYYADFMTVAANRWAGTALGGYARSWLQLTGTAPRRFVAAVDAGGASADVAALPPDYYAPGPGWFFGRNAWTPAATVLLLQLGALTGVGHEHDDAGTWQLWRDGWWLSRESTSYAESVTGYAGTGTFASGDLAPHNGVLVNGKGYALGERNGPPVVRRLESRPDYAFAAVDLSAQYRNDQVPWSRPERDNPAVKHVERDFVFLRGLETLLILDRVESNAVGATAAADVPKAFLAHFEQAPTVHDPAHVTAANGNQAARLTVLVPSSVLTRTIDEGPSGQHRLEVEVRGEAQSYTLVAVQARDSGAADATVAVTDLGTAFQVDLARAGADSARVVFQKGMASAGGRVEVGGRQRSLAAGIQSIQVTDAGPVWGP